MKRLIVITALVLSLVACANIEKRIMNEFPGADQIQNLEIKYDKDLLMPGAWSFTVCYDIPLVGCISGQGATWEDVLKNMKNKYIDGENG